MPDPFVLIFVLLPAAVLVVVFVVGLVAGLLLRLLRRRWPRRFLRRLLASIAVLAFALPLVVVPSLLGWLATHGRQTRSDERHYEGPQIDAEGRWLEQSRATLRGVPAGRRETDPALLAGAARRCVMLKTVDGLWIRAFFVPARGEPEHPAVVLAHGLFRGGLEIEAPGRMFHELGCEVVLVELRGHGGSDAATTTFGVDEALDVRAAVDWLQRDDPGRRVVLFGVSMGAGAVALAAPHVRGLAGIVLDSPFDTLLDTGHRALSMASVPGRRRISIPQPFRSLTLLSVGIWAGIDLAEVSTLDALRNLRPGLPALVVGGGADQRMPPDVVQRVFEALPRPRSEHELWIRPGSDHGSVWADDPDGYRQRLRRFLSRVGPP